MDKDTFEKIKRLSKEEAIEYIKTLPQGSYFRLAYSHERIMVIVDFIKLINKHLTELEYPSNKNFVYEGSKFSPTETLYDYIYLEADCFFQYAKKCLSKKDRNMPPLPKYHETLHWFRNKILGHRDIDEAFQTTTEWIEVHQKMDSEVKPTQLIKDIDEYYKEVRKREKNE